MLEAGNFSNMKNQNRSKKLKMISNKRKMMFKTLSAEDIVKHFYQDKNCENSRNLDIPDVRYWLLTIS